MSGLLALAGLYGAFVIAVALIKLVSDGQTAESLAWNAAMAFGWAFWLLVFGAIIYALVRTIRWLIRKVASGAETP